jgi:hypothetical protein
MQEKGLNCVEWEEVCRGGKGAVGEIVKGLTNRSAQDVTGLTISVAGNGSQKPEAKKPEARRKACHAEFPPSGF